jgi:PAS domain S-box-containing protein
MIFRSIKTRILWSHIVAILLVNIVLGGLTYRFLVDKLIASERKNLEFITDHLAEMLRHNVLRKEEVLRRVASGQEVVDYLETYRDLALAAYLADFQKELPHLSLLNREGREEVKVREGENVEVRATAYDQVMMDRTLANPNAVEIVFDREVDNRRSSLLYLAFSKYEYFGDVYRGTLLAAVPYRTLLHEVAATHIHSSGLLVLWGDGQDDIFVQESGPGHQHDPRAILRIAASHADGRKFLEIAAGQARVRQAEILGTESMVAHVPLADLQLHLLLTLPHDKITTQLSHLRNQAMLVFLALCLVAALLSYLLAATITRPISTLTRVTRAIAAGSRDTHDLAMINNRTDEVGVLVASFQEMMDSLWRTMVSRDYVDRIFAAISESVLVVTADGAIRRANRAACRLLGYEEEELLRLAITDILVEGGEAALGSCQGESWRETAYRHKDGGTVPVLCSCSALVGTGGSQETVWVASDITGLQKAREALEENKYYFNALVRSLPCGLLVIDADNSIVIDVNEAACRLLRSSRSEIIGRDCFDFMAPVALVAAWPPVLTSETSISNMECELVPAAAPRVPVVISVQAITLRDSLISLVTFVDISDRKKMALALEASQQRLRRLGDQAGPPSEDC